MPQQGVFVLPKDVLDTPRLGGEENVHDATAVVVVDLGEVCVCGYICVWVGRVSEREGLVWSMVHIIIQAHMQTSTC